MDWNTLRFGLVWILHLSGIFADKNDRTNGIDERNLGGFRREEKTAGNEVVRPTAMNDRFEFEYSVKPQHDINKRDASQVDNGVDERAIEYDENNLQDLAHEPRTILTNEPILSADSPDMSGDRYYENRIKPTKSHGYEAVGKSAKSLDVTRLEGLADVKLSGEGYRVPHKKQLLMEPDIAKLTTNATYESANGTSASRQSGDDLDDIITGFVKLLNGSPNSPPTSPGKQHSFHTRTRINNRGPPRISDVPPIIFESVPPPPPLSSTTKSPPSTFMRDPPPYPFEPSSLPSQPPNVLKPFVAGIPLPELLIPLANVTKAPPSSTASDIDASEEEYIKKFDKTTPTKKYSSVIQRDPPIRTPSNSTKVGTEAGLAPAKQSDNHPVSGNSGTTNNASLVRVGIIEKVELPIVTMTPKISHKKNNVELPGTSAGSHGNNVELPGTSAGSHGNNVESPGTSAGSHGNNVELPGSDVKSQGNDVESPGTNKKSQATESGSHGTHGINLGSHGTHSASENSSIFPVFLETSTVEVSTLSAETSKGTSPVSSTASNIRRKPSNQHAENSSGGYFPRPGIVLDDPEYKPGAHRRPLPTSSSSIITAPPSSPNRNKDVFDITVSAVQGPGGNSNGSVHSFVFPGESEVNGGEASVITSAEEGQNYVSIDGKRTYLNLFDNADPTNGGASISTSPQQPAKSTLSPHPTSHNQPPQLKSSTKAPISGHAPWRKPTHPPVRIDTCIVGDDSTCDVTQHERCHTEVGVSSCHCRPGYTRRKHRDTCHRVVSLCLSVKVDRMYDQRLSWSNAYTQNSSAEYQQLEYEAIKAIDSALSMTPFSDSFMNARVNNFHTSAKAPPSNPPVYVNMTVQLTESAETLRTAVKQDLQKHLLGVLHRRNNNIGSSPLWVESPNAAVLPITDLDECSDRELNDCSRNAQCINVFGGFQCVCGDGYRDPVAGNTQMSGRTCDSCDQSHCNHRGQCSYHNGQPVCRCVGNYYGAQCEIDGEVLGVAIGSSVIALLIILATLAALCAWSRRWNNEQKVCSPIFGYMPSGASTVKTPSMGAPPYQISLEDRLKWAQIADAMAHANHYGPEPVIGTMGSRRPFGSSLFGYTMQSDVGSIMMPRLRPPGGHTMMTAESSTSEEEDRDRADLLGRHFHVPRPKSHASIANQSGIYYDVDYDSQQQQQKPTEIFSTLKSSQATCIPMSTYTMGSRSHYFR